MLARHMRRAQLLELALYAAIALALHRRGMGTAAAFALVPGLLLGTRLVMVCSMFALAWLHRMARPRGRRIGPLRAIAMVLREYGAFLVLNFWRTPWEQLALRPDPAPDAPGAPAIVLVHGYFANRGCWTPFVQALERAGLAPVYVPTCRSHLASIEQFEEDLNREIERVAGDRPIILVAHSMGGLAARLYMVKRGSARVARLVTIGSPHHGTRLAPWGIGANARQMVPGSAFLRELEAREARGEMPPTLAIYSVHDNMVLPQDSARLPWARNVAVEGIGHVSQFASARIANLVIEELGAGS